MSDLMDKKQNLIWLDLEMTGLRPESDLIIEIGTLVTDADLNVIAEGPVLAIKQPDAALAAMDDWNQSHHGESGLLKRVRESSCDMAQAEVETIAFLENYVPAGKSPMCGNSICQDRRFMFRLMPILEEYFHYRNLDVSTVKELASRWKPDIIPGFQKKGCHLAMDDIVESIDEMKYFRQHFIDV